MSNRADKYKTSTTSAQGVVRTKIGQQKPLQHELSVVDEKSELKPKPSPNNRV